MTTIPTWFETKFESNVRHQFQQTTSKLQGTVFAVRNVKGKTVSFPILAKGGVTKNKPAHTDQQVQTGGHSNKTVTLDDYTAGRYVGKLDVHKLSPNVQQKYEENLSFAGGREMDSIILDAHDDCINTGSATGTNLNSITTSGGLTYEKVMAANKYLLKNLAGMNSSKKTLVVDEEGWEDLTLETEFQSSDFVTYRVAQTGSVPMVAGAEVIVIDPNLMTGRVVSASATYARLYVEDAIAFAVAQDIDVNIDYIPQKHSHYVGMDFSATAGDLLETGAVRIDVGQ